MTTRANGNGKGKAPVRFAVVGLGHFAQAAILPAFASADGCELVALISGDPRKRAVLSRRYRPAVALDYADYDTYLRSGAVDAVYVATPNDRHADFVQGAARAGVHVLCEKPLAPEVTTADRLRAVCQSADVRLMVAYRLHFEAANLELVERVARGDIGRPRYLSTTFSLQVRDGNIRTQRDRGGGPLLDLGIYCVNAARYVFGSEPTTAVARAASADERRFNEIDEQVSALLTFPDDRLAQLTCAFGAYDQSSLSVVGTKGRLWLEPAFDYATDLVLGAELEGRKPTRKVFPKRDQIAAELVAFARAVRDGVDPEPSGTEAVADLRALDAIARSLESGRVEDVARGEEPRERPSKRQEIRRPPHGMPPLVRAQSGSRP
jgi:glucose-fructose oxidoreductase